MEALVVSVDEEESTEEEEVARTTDAPHGAASLKFHGSPVSFVPLSRHRTVE